MIVVWSSVQFFSIGFVRYICIYVFCLNDLLFHDFHKVLFKKVHDQAWSMPLSGIILHIHLFYILILIPYGIMGNLVWQNWTTGETFHIFLHQNWKAMNFWKIRIDSFWRRKMSLVFHFQSLFPTEFGKTGSETLPQIVVKEVLMYSCLKNPL